MTAVAAPTDFLPGQKQAGTQPGHAGQDPTSPRATVSTEPTHVPPVGGTLPEPTKHVPTPIPATSAQDPTSGSGQTGHDAQAWAAAAGSDSPIGQCIAEAQMTIADGGTDQSEGSAVIELTTPNVPALLDPSLSLVSELVDDLEAQRMAQRNRVRAYAYTLGVITKEQVDADKLKYEDIAGLLLRQAILLKDKDLASLVAVVDQITSNEHDAVLLLQRRMRRHPLGAWAKAQKGIGEKTFARFLATLGGDPYINHNTGQPRTVSQLWAYCGHGDPTRRKRKGMTQDDLFALGNPDAKKRLYLIATTCLKAQGHYADVYYARRQRTEDRAHAADCIRCGPSGKPAPEGSPWSAAHQHADALRIVGKEILRDLWTEAKRIHEGEAS